MAEITNNSKQIKGKRLIRKSTRVDLTPMVDLGFLLITFFVFTTTMSSVKAMAMVSPKDNTTKTDDLCESCVITILAAANNKLFYYEGSEKIPNTKRRLTVLRAYEHCWLQKRKK